MRKRHGQVRHRGGDAEGSGRREERLAPVSHRRHEWQEPIWACRATLSHAVHHWDPANEPGGGPRVRRAAARVRRSEDLVEQRNGNHAPQQDASLRRSWKVEEQGGSCGLRDRWSVFNMLRRDLSSQQHAWLARALRGVANASRARQQVGVQRFIYAAENVHTHEKPPHGARTHAHSPRARALG